MTAELVDLRHSRSEIYLYIIYIHFCKVEIPNALHKNMNNLGKSNVVLFFYRISVHNIESDFLDL